jgi:2'-5' RNA ligase
MDTVRAFIAIELNPTILQALSDLQASLRQDVPPKLVRWVRPQGIHLTLKFLGDVPRTKVDSIAEAMRAVCARHAPFSFAVGGMGCFPNPRRPRVVWVGVDEPSGVLARLQRDVDRAISPLGFPAEKRRFHPHLTLGRVKGRNPDAVAALGEYVSRAQVKVGEMRAEAVHLMRSELQPGGAVYTELAAASLAG